MNICKTIIIIATATLINALAQATPTTVVLGTATEGGGFELYGRHLAEVINEVEVPLKIEIRATRGSAEKAAAA